MNIRSFPSTPVDHYRRVYYEAVDLITTCINNRFDQPGYKIYHNIEDLLLKAFNTENYDEELNFFTQFYGSDFDGYLLKTQLEVLSTDFAASLEKNTSFLMSLSCLRVNLKLKRICYLKYASF